MEEAPKIITNALECKHCDTPHDEASLFCHECGYPLKGTEEDVAKFYAKRVMDKRKSKDAEKKIKSARTTLYVIAGIIMVFGFFIFLSSKDVTALIINIIVGVIYIVLGTWSKHKPLIALLLGLLLYLTIIVITAIAEPKTLVSGIIWKIVIIAYLAKGIHSASSVNKLA